MESYLSLVLHGHLPFVRHPEHETFLEENWLFEAVVESYLPILQMMEGWRRDGVPGRLTMTLSPTLCSMLRDPLLQVRCLRYLDGLVALAEKETFRTHWDLGLRPAAEFYLDRLQTLRSAYLEYGKDLVAAFRQMQDAGLLEVITCAATHALLPLLLDHPSSIRGQILCGRDHYQSCFGRDPRGIWLPECAYAPELEAFLREAGLQWCLIDTHGVMLANPPPRYGIFAPILTPGGLAVFGRDKESARQVWSRNEGYPGDARYRDFYRDIGFELDFDYLKPYLPAPPHRSFTGIKYYAITGPGVPKRPYQRAAAMQAVREHAKHFVGQRHRQLQAAGEAMGRPPILVCPYDAELFGHWWYEGPEFLDAVVRLACAEGSSLRLIQPAEYLREHRTHQVASPCASSWGEEGYWKVWLNETNEWIYPHLRVAQGRMTELSRRPGGTDLEHRAIRQAARELMLAQSSDWPFILKSGTSPEYARKRVKGHLLRFLQLADQIHAGVIDPQWLEQIEERDNIFPELNFRHWS